VLNFIKSKVKLVEKPIGFEEFKEMVEKGN
jgi:hypothetical protein